VAVFMLFKWILSSILAVVKQSAMTKPSKEQIKSAYWIYWEQFKDKIDDEGFIKWDYLPNHIACTPMFKKIYRLNSTYFIPYELVYPNEKPTFEWLKK